MLLGRIAERRFEHVRKLGAELMELLPPLSAADIAVAAAASSLAEEVFFRGVMQHAWGIWPTVAVFSVVHGFFHPKYWVWMAFAGLMGVAFGYATHLLGSVLAGVVAHFTINYVNLHRLERKRRLAEVA